MMQNEGIQFKLDKCSRLESQFKSLVQTVYKQVEESQNASQKSQDAVIFIGETGSGKSTIVNWLNSAEFEVKEDHNQDAILEMKTEQEQVFSQTGSGTKSVTLYPQYSYNDSQKILTIDFPGFRDTRGWQEQLIIKMMYMDVIAKFSTRVVIVQEQPAIKIQSRGVFIQELIQQTFQPHDDAQIDSICFILNLFVEGEKKIQQLKNKISLDLEEMERNVKDKKQQQVYKALQKNIQVVEKIDSEEKFNLMFNDKNRQELWQAIKQTKPIKIQCNQLENSFCIGEYLQIMSDMYLQRIHEFIEDTWSLKIIQTYDIERLNQMIKQLEVKIYQLQSQKDIVAFQLITKFLDELYQLTHSKNSSTIPTISKQYETFFQLYQFFVRYDKFIQGFRSSEEYIVILNNYFSFLKQALIFQSQKLELENQQNQEIKKLEEEKKNLIEEKVGVYKEIFTMQNQQIQGCQDSMQWSQNVTQDLLKMQFSNNSSNSQIDNQKIPISSIEQVQTSIIIDKQEKIALLKDIGGLFSKIQAIKENFKNKYKKSYNFWFNYERSQQEEVEFIQVRDELQSKINSHLLQQSEQSVHQQKLDNILKTISKCSKEA